MPLFPVSTGQSQLSNLRSFNEGRLPPPPADVARTWPARTGQRPLPSGEGCAPPEAGPAEEDKGGLQARPSSGGCIYVCLCLSTWDADHWNEAPLHAAHRGTPRIRRGSGSEGLLISVEQGVASHTFSKVREKTKCVLNRRWVGNTWSAQRVNAKSMPPYQPVSSSRTQRAQLIDSGRNYVLGSFMCPAPYRVLRDRNDSNKSNPASPALLKTSKTGQQAIRTQTGNYRTMGVIAVSPHRALWKRKYRDGGVGEVWESLLRCPCWHWKAEQDLVRENVPGRPNSRHKGPVGDSELTFQEWSSFWKLCLTPRPSGSHSEFRGCYDFWVNTWNSEEQRGGWKQQCGRTHGGSPSRGAQERRRAAGTNQLEREET